MYITIYMEIFIPDVIKIIIPGTPIPQARPRLGKYGVYDPKASDKKKVISYIKSSYKLQDCIDNFPLAIKMTFFMPFPKASSKAYIQENYNNSHIKKPDIDNLAKFYLDIMKGFVYTDDSLVAKICLQKVYSTEPKTVINISKDMILDTINEHVLCYKELTIQDIEYISRKANCLGYKGRDIHKVFTTKEGDKTHLYFEVDGLNK